MPLIRVKYKHGMAAEYLTVDGDYYINWNPNWRDKYKGHSSPQTYFTNAERESGTSICTFKVEKAFQSGGLEIIRGKEKPPHIK